MADHVVDTEGRDVDSRGSSYTPGAPLPFIVSISESHEGPDATQERDNNS
jgi:hypothetical protein